MTKRKKVKTKPSREALARAAGAELGRLLGRAFARFLLGKKATQTHCDPAKIAKHRLSYIIPDDRMAARGLIQTWRTKSCAGYLFLRDVGARIPYVFDKPIYRVGK